MPAVHLLITPDKLSRLLPHFNPGEIDTWVKVFSEVAIEYRINTGSRLASFIGNCIHESGGLRRLEENLNYTSAARLLKIFPRDFKSLEDAQAYVGKPEKIANRVYANQGGNGNEASGDGWRYRGRGAGQLTLRANYAKYSKFKNIDFIKTPDLVSTPLYAVDSFAWYFKVNKLHRYADNWDLRGLTKAINGGYNGLADREKNCIKAVNVLIYDKVS